MKTLRDIEAMRDQARRTPGPEGSKLLDEAAVHLSDLAEQMSTIRSAALLECAHCRHEIEERLIGPDPVTALQRYLVGMARVHGISTREMLILALQNGDELLAELSLHAWGLAL